MLLVCAGMLRSGSVVQFQLAGAVVTHLGIGEIVKPRTGEELDANIDDWAFSDRWHVIKMHEYRKSIMRGHDQGRVKVTMVIRDPRDIMVSLMNFRDDTFETMTHAPVFPNNLLNHPKWSGAIHASNFRCVKYEQMIASFINGEPSLSNEVWAIDRFINGEAKIPGKEMVEIADRYSIKANKLRAAAEYRPEHPDYFSKRHIHDGSSGQWKTALDEDQIRWVEDVAKDFMEVNGYALAYPGGNHTDV